MGSIQATMLWLFTFTEKDRNMTLGKILAFSLALVLAACGIQPAPRPTPTPFTGTPRPVLIDTDMAGDDWMAILYLLNRPDVSVAAITVSGTGEAHCEPGIKNAMSLAALAGQPDLPVSCGRTAPLQGDHAFPPDWRARVDGFAGLTLPSNPASPVTQPAAELLTTKINSLPGKATIITLGPLTNLAEALQSAPELKERIEMVYIMGGALDVPGNVGMSGAGIDNSVAEWNMYIDPRAAAIVLQSGAPVTLVPLDATNHAPLTRKFFDRLKGDRKSPEAAFVFDVLAQYSDFIQSGRYYFWDPLAAAILTDHSLAAFEIRSLTVIEEESNQSGRTQASESGAPVRVAVDVEAERFEQLFLDTLNGSTADEMP
jgi:pyrimidine-specific ribonucleoside hydrolase